MFPFAHAACLLACLPASLHAQTVPAPTASPLTIAPSLVTPGGNRQAPIIIPPSEATRLDVAIAPLEAPPGAERLQIKLSDLDVTGSFADLATAHAVFRRDVIGHVMNLADVYAAAARLEAAYAKAGYVLVRIAIPPQRVEDGGTLQVNVVDGTIEAIDDTGLPKRVQAYVRARLAPLIGQPHVRLAEIERRLTLAGSAAGLSLRSALKTGTHPGTTRLVVEGRLAYATFDLSWDNSLPASLGSHMVTASTTLNNLTGHGEQITLTTGQSDNLNLLGSASSPYAMEAVSLNLPLGAKGLSLSANHIQSRTLQTGNASYLNSLGHFERTGASLNAALVAGHDVNLTLSMGADSVVQIETLPFFALTLNRDAYTSLRLGLTGWQRFVDGSVVSGELHLSQGLVGRAQPLANEVAYSQVGARNDYTKLGARVTWHTNLDARTSLTLTGNGQTGFGAPLFVSEKLALASVDGISATVPGQLIADSGLSLRNDLAHTITIHGTAGPITVSPYAFSAVGFGWLEQPVAATKHYDVQALGAGMRWSAIIGNGHANFSLEYGHCLCAAAIGQDDNRLNLTAGIGF